MLEITQNTGVEQGEVFNTEDKETYPYLNKLLNSLSPIEREIVVLFYGIGASERLSLGEISEYMQGKVTKETIGRHKRKAMHKLRVKVGKEFE